MRFFRKLFAFPIIGMLTGKIYGVPVSRNPMLWIPYLLLLPVLLAGFLLLMVLYVVFVAIHISVSLIAPDLLRSRCPHCNRRGLSGGRLAGDASINDGDDRDFFWSECHYCRHQFHEFDDGARIHIPPGDTRFLPE